MFCCFFDILHQFKVTQTLNFFRLLLCFFVKSIVLCLCAHYSWSLYHIACPTKALLVVVVVFVCSCTLHVPLSMRASCSHFVFVCVQQSVHMNISALERDKEPGQREHATRCCPAHSCPSCSLDTTPSFKRFTFSALYLVYVILHPNSNESLCSRAAPY